MMEEIQKSIRLINFGDSIFDADEKSVDNSKITVETEEEKSAVVNSGMLSSASLIRYLWKRTNKLVDSDATEGTAELLGKRKHVQFEELLFSYFNHCENEELLMEILVTYSPFIVTKEQFELMTRKESERVKEIEVKCFGAVLGEYKLNNLMVFYSKIFSNNSKNNEYEVLCKRIPCQLMLKEKDFDAKGLAKAISLFEAAEYSKLNFYDFYKKNSNGNFVFIFNKLTNFLISEILKTETRNERKLIVKRILKLAKELSKIGAMNSLKGCMAAIESSSVHRLNVIKDQTIKYQKRFEKLSLLTAAENNFKGMRESACIVPWLGIILRDFTFIKELAYKTTSSGSVNIPLALCLWKLMNSMTAAREACEQFLRESEEEQMRRAAVMGKWLETVEILYENEEAQYERSITILKCL